MQKYLTIVDGISNVEIIFNTHMSNETLTK